MRRWLKVSLVVVALVLVAVVGYGLFNYLSSPKQFERHGFRLVTPEEKDRLLRRYWRIPAPVETSVVLREEDRAQAAGARARSLRLKCL